MKNPRYIYKRVPIPVEEARAQRAEDVLQIEAQISALEEERRALKKAPLPIDREVQVTLNPGDEGYDEAPERFSPGQYQGDLAWVNIPNRSWPEDAPLEAGNSSLVCANCEQEFLGVPRRTLCFVCGGPPNDKDQTQPDNAPAMPTASDGRPQT